MTSCMSRLSVLALALSVLTAPALAQNVMSAPACQCSAPTLVVTGAPASCTVCAVPCPA